MTTKPFPQYTTITIFLMHALCGHILKYCCTLQLWIVIIIIIIINVYIIIACLPIMWKLLTGINWT